MSEYYSPTGYVALYDESYTDTAGVKVKYMAKKAVMKWDEETGDAMVVLESRGRLIRAAALDGFHGLQEGKRLVGVIPAVGWEMVYRDRETGEVSRMPVAGFAVDGEGWADALTLEHPDGLSPHMESSNVDSELVGPGEQTTWEIEAARGAAPKTIS